MRLNINLVVLSFIIIIAIIFMADSMTTAVLLITLIVNFIVVCVHLSSIENECEDSMSSQSSTMTAADIGPAVQAAHPGMQQSGYGIEHDLYSHMNEHFSPPTPFPITSASDGIVGVDSANVIMAQQRTRDKRAMTAAATKTANYYRHHFADELEESEAKRWWGANEF